MADLIDREALIETKSQTYTVEYGEYIGEDAREIPMVSVERILAAPAVDAVEVVRCKDCSHCMYETCMRSLRKCKPTDFCSYGEREDGRYRP